MSTTTKTAKERAKAAVAARVKRLDKEGEAAFKKKKANLRAKVRGGSRAVRKKAASDLSAMPKQWKN